MSPPLIGSPSREQRARIAAYAAQGEALTVEVRNLWRQAYFTGRRWNERHPDGPPFKVWPFVYKRGRGLRPADLAWVDGTVQLRLDGIHTDTFREKQARRGRKGGQALRASRAGERSEEMAEVARLHTANLSIRAISARTGVPRSTVHRWIHSEANSRAVPEAKSTNQLGLVLDEGSEAENVVLHTLVDVHEDQQQNDGSTWPSGHLEMSEWHKGLDLLEGQRRGLQPG